MLKNNGPFAAVSPKKMSPIFKKTRCSVFQGPLLNFLKSLMLNVVHREWNVVAVLWRLLLGRRVALMEVWTMLVFLVFLAQVPSLPEVLLDIPHCCDGEASGRGNAAGSPIELVVDTSAHRVSRAGRCRGRGSARCADWDQAAMTKLHAEEKDASQSKRDLEDGIVAVRSMLGVLCDYGGADTDHVTASGSEETVGLHVSHSSFDNSSNSLGCVAAVACARLPAVPSVSARVCPVSSSSAVSAAAAAHARSTPLHGAHDSWSYTGRVKGPTGRRCTKGGVSGPAEDLRPISEVEAGVNFRPAGGVRGQVAGSLSGRQPGTGTRRVREDVVTPSWNPIRVTWTRIGHQGINGLTKVCSTTRSGIWVLKGNARARMLPENLDHLWVKWISRRTYETACYAKARLSLFIPVWTGSSYQTTNQ